MEPTSQGLDNTALGMPATAPPSSGSMVTFNFMGLPDHVFQGNNRPPRLTGSTTPPTYVLAAASSSSSQLSSSLLLNQAPSGSVIPPAPRPAHPVGGASSPPGFVAPHLSLLNAGHHPNTGHHRQPPVMINPNDGNPFALCDPFVCTIDANHICMFCYGPLSVAPFRRSECRHRIHLFCYSVRGPVLKREECFFCTYGSPANCIMMIPRALIHR